MIESSLIEMLTKVGYQRINSNVNGITISLLVRDEEAYIVTIVHALTGEEFTWEQYENILFQIKNNFMNQKYRQIHLLSIICTELPDRVKHFCVDKDDHWIIDIATNRLIIYENQSSNYMGLKDIIEQLFAPDGDGNNTNQANYRTPNNYNQSIPRRSIDFSHFTLCNTILIGINIIVFLIVQYSGWFGGTEEIKYNGALSWFQVKYDKEYFRVITSMFLHSDFNHLFNNMLVLLFVGDKLERATGRIKYLLIYFGAGILAGITSIGYNMMKDAFVISIGASGAIFGVVGAMIYILILNKGHLEDINARQIIMFVIFSLYGGITSVGIDNAAHIGGFLAGIILAAIFYRRPKHGTDRNKLL